MKLIKKIRSLSISLYEIFFRFFSKFRLKNKTPTIICNTCIGGYIYHRLGLQFLSPTVNLWFSSNDAIKLLLNPEKYFSMELKHIGEENNHPVCCLGDIVLHFNHSDSFVSANSEWVRRKQRIDYTNCFAIIVDMNNELDFENYNLKRIKSKYKNVIILNKKIDNGMFKRINIRFEDEWHFNFFGVHDWEKQWNFIKFLNCK